MRKTDIFLVYTFTSRLVWWLARNDVLIIPLISRRCLLSPPPVCRIDHNQSISFFVYLPNKTTRACVTSFLRSFYVPQYVKTVRRISGIRPNRNDSRLPNHHFAPKRSRWAWPCWHLRLDEAVDDDVYVHRVILSEGVAGGRIVFLHWTHLCITEIINSPATNP